MLIEKRDSLSVYLMEINKIPLLSEKEEKELAKKVAQGDEEARRRLIESNLRFVVKIAGEYIGCGLPLSDLIGEGNEGLIKAVNRFKPEKNCKFTTYSVWWIRQAVTHAIADKKRTVRLPWNVAVELSKLAKIKKKLNYDSLPENISKENLENLSRLTGISQERVEYLLYISQNTVPLDSLINEGEDYLLEHMNSEHVNPEEEIYDSLSRKGLTDFLDNTRGRYLSSEEVDILKRRCGFGDYEFGQSLDEIGKEYDLTREGIRQIEKHARVKIKMLLKEFLSNEPAQGKIK